MKARFALLLIGCLLGPGHAFAARSSAKYSVPAEALDAGGRKASSAKYSDDGSLGSFGGIGTNAAAETAKSGYIGQLYEVSALIIGAVSTNVVSGSNTQLNATARLDDGAFLRVATTQVVWSVVSGPIVSIDTNGLATAGIVSQNTAATVRGDSLGQFGTLPLMVLSTGPKSSPRIMSFSLTAGGFVVSGTNGTAGASYYVLSSTNVALPLTNWTRLATNTFDGSGNFNFTNAITGGQHQRFYLLQVP